MTLSAFQKGKIDAYLEKHSEALFKTLCEKHKVNMDNLDDADPHALFNLVTDLRADLEGTPAYVPSETKQAATTTAKVLQDPKAQTQKTFTPQAQKPIKKLEDYLIDLRACYPGRRFEIKTTIMEKSGEFCLTKCEILISDKDLGFFKFEAFGYSTKEEEGTGLQKKYMIPLSEARAVKRACRLATVGVKPMEGK
jgi:hypothetical protein